MAYSAATQHTDSELDLIKLLRKRILDDTYTRPAFTLFLTEGIARSASIQIQHGYLRIELVNSSKPDQNILLTGRGVDTLGGLAKFLDQPGYCLKQTPNMHHDHPSLDLHLDHGNLLKKGVVFTHRRFSDSELRECLQQAAVRHNMTYTVQSVPRNEYTFVVALASADVCRIQAQFAVKRRGLDMDSKELRELAKDYETSYDRDVKRQRRVIPLARMKDSKVERGDVIVGSRYRRTLRTNYMAPVGTQEAPEEPLLFEPEEGDIQDNQVRLLWERVRDTDLSGLEIWRDTSENVQRSQLGNVTVADPASFPEPVLATTSKLVYSARGTTGDIRFGRSALVAYGGPYGQTANQFIDGLENDAEFFQGTPLDSLPLDPETTYYYRLYAFDLNGLAVGSNTVQATTKVERAKLSRDASGDALDPRIGPIAGGTPITIKGTNFHPHMRVKLGDKPVDNFVFVDTETVTAEVPQVKNPAIVQLPADLVIISETGLVDAAFKVFQYTET